VYEWIASTSCNKVQAFCPTSTKKPSGKGTSSPVVAAKASKEADSYTKDEIDAMISRQSDVIADLKLDETIARLKIAILNLEIDALKSCLNYKAFSNTCVLEANNVFINSIEGDINLIAGNKINTLYLLRAESRAGVSSRSRIQSRAMGKAIKMGSKPSAT
jgi:hypothetical protein